MPRNPFVYEKIITEPQSNLEIDFSEIINNAMSEVPISYSDFKIALKELLPENTYTLDQTCMQMPNELKNILLEYNKNNSKCSHTCWSEYCGSNNKNYNFTSNRGIGFYPTKKDNKITITGHQNSDYQQNKDLLR